MTGEDTRPPYPGLRSFRREETDLFFGREDCIYTLVDRLAQTRFLAVLGSSGTGKSSIVKTGLLEALEIGLMEKAGARWRIIDFRPGSTPLTNLARELLKSGARGKEPDNIETKILRGFLARGPRSIIEWCQDGNLPGNTNLLLLVDQFEELFRYQGYAGKEESEAFVALLLECAHSREFPIYVTLTMRSEYLGACALMEGLAETISRGMVLTPRMTREQCRRAIVGPAEVCGIRIEEPLVNQLLNDLANFAPWDDSGSSDQLDRLVRRADQLPLLQYTLNRLWLDARNRGSGEQIQLRLSDYKAIGGLGGALDMHGNELLGELTKKGLAAIVEKIFRALTAGATVAEAVRRPQQFGDLVALCDGDARAVEEVLYKFCAPGCNFLAPELADPGPEKRVPLDRNMVIDISHESLIRQWKKLAEWLHDETVAAQHWRRLKDRMADGEPIRGRELENLTGWRDDKKPNEAWAKRYGGGYKDAMAFLEKSERAENARRRSRFILIVAGVFLEVVALAGVAAFMAYKASVATSQLTVTIDELHVTNAELAKQKALLEANLTELAKRESELEAKNKELAKQQASLNSLLAEAQKRMAEQKPKGAIDLGPEPIGTYQDEDKDEHVSPTDKLTSNLDGPTPISIPGGKVLTTKQLYDALMSGTIKDASNTNVPIVLIDVGSQLHPKTLPTAYRWSYAGAGGTFDDKDKIQKRLFDDLSKTVKAWNNAIVFFSRDAKSWEAYNAALRAIEMGFPNVFWYRGGLASWEDAQLKMVVAP
ncbi:MAG: hypothetical protein WCF20_08390 [Methylovirgula sp.]